MSLYYEAATILDESESNSGSLKSRVYSNKSLKSNPGQLYALLSESAKWSSVLKVVVEKAELLHEERKLTPALALVLTHDLLLTKRGVILPATHALKAAVIRHKARLSAELTRYRVQQGFGTLEALRKDVETRSGSSAQENGGLLVRPRWARINALTNSKSWWSEFKDYTKVDDLKDVMSVDADKKYYKDEKFPDIMAVPSTTKLVHTAAYDAGHLILQDKASCFPAYMLQIDEVDGDIVDACAAPGNKTTHLAALLYDLPDRKNRKVVAFERDKSRHKILKSMISRAKASAMVPRVLNEDFLSVNPQSDQYKDVQALLLDPSCSGSGIVGRDEGKFEFELPAKDTASKNPSKGHQKRSKADRKPKTDQNALVDKEESPNLEERPLDVDSSKPNALEDRLESLANFQSKIITHAMNFPAARRISYSTCSVHTRENESVVLSVLCSAVAKERGWRIMRRSEQYHGLRDWKHRGVDPAETSSDSGLTQPSISGAERAEILEGCIRCNKENEEGTMGFFVGGFIRDPSDSGETLDEDEDEDEDEWNGFSDSEVVPEAAANEHPEQVATA